MSDSICRSLRDGALDGEHAPALTLKDSLDSPFGARAFDHFLCNLASNVSLGRSQAKSLVLVAFDRSPSSYLELLKSREIDVSSHDWLRIVDCYSDPLGWQERISNSGSVNGTSLKTDWTVATDVRDIYKLLNVIVDLGKGAVELGKVRFSPRFPDHRCHLPIQFISMLSLFFLSVVIADQVSCVFWLVHSDLHESKTVASLEYVSTMVASLEPRIHHAKEEMSHSENLLWLQQNSSGGKFNVRLKRRNGRVKVFCEEFLVEKVGLKFIVVPSENAIVNQTLAPKVQFNLQLSEKERQDRAKVVLPFEHQGNGEDIRIYDGRRSLSKEQDDPHMVGPAMSSTRLQTDSDRGRGEIHYFRDSDEEQLDSDEDPDDDLDI
ncbi:Elongator complex protein 5 [Acorus calamus]|uniref:Elongator complex protein 5 n=1 Tax=Acorus calamus TaxID=4465 RepID=A0AAV9DC59_ACOCL|nr:Elongator complex protein 5 [Acorus calamus]